MEMKLWKLTILKIDWRSDDGVIARNTQILNAVLDHEAYIRIFNATAMFLTLYFTLIINLWTWDDISDEFLIFCLTYGSS